MGASRWGMISENFGGGSGIGGRDGRVISNGGHGTSDESGMLTHTRVGMNNEAPGLWQQLDQDDKKNKKTHLILIKRG